MAYDKFLIAPMEEGIRTDLKPWLIPDNAFETMNNAYVFRGRVRKRFGSTYSGNNAPSVAEEPMYSRARINLSTLRIALAGGAGVGITDGAGAATGTVPNFVYRIGQRFSIGAEIFTVTVLGTPGVMATTGGSVTHTFNTTTGAYVFAGAAINTQIYFYPYGNLGVGATDGAGDVTGFVPGAIFKQGQQFSIGANYYTVITSGAGQHDMIRTDGVAVIPANNCWFNNTTGEFTILGAALATDVYFYPSDPIMGIEQFQSGSVNDQPTLAWDTQFAYRFNGSSWELSPNALWHGRNYDFCWSSTWHGSTVDIHTMFTTNFHATVPTPGATDDPIWAYDGTDWFVFRPYFHPAGGAVGTGPFVQTARIILPFRGCLLLLDTIENDGAGNNVHFPFRCRYSQIGSPFAANAWYEQNQEDATAPAATGRWAGGGLIDATTEEEIVSAEFNKDRLIVYFERSTWEIVYTGDPVAPFIFQKLNTELGADATFSKVSFDRDVLVVGNTGIHACNGTNVVRIDDKIPDTVFNMRSKNQARERVCGIRDFYTEMVYWTYPASGVTSYNDTFPNKVLVYNYKNKTWAFNDDTITAFGYFENKDSLTWAAWHTPWESSTFTWNSGSTNANFRYIAAGNQEGFIFILDTEEAKNAAVLQITNMTVSGGRVTALTIENHNITDSFIKVSNAQGITELNDKIFHVYATGLNTLALVDPIDVVGVYTGGGVVSRVSNISFSSKQWNPYIDKALNLQLAKIDFLVDTTSYGAINVEYFSNAADWSIGDDAVTNQCNYGLNGGDTVLQTSPYVLLYPQEALQERVWHPMYFQGDGNCIQLKFSMTDDMMKTVNVAESPFQLHALLLHTKPTASTLL